MSYRLDWLVPSEHARAALDKIEKGSEQFDTEQAARARKADLRVTLPECAIITGPYRTAYVGRFSR